MQGRSFCLCDLELHDINPAGRYVEREWSTSHFFEDFESLLRIMGQTTMTQKNYDEIEVEKVKLARVLSA